MDGIAFSMTTVKKGQPADTVNDKGRQIQITPPPPSSFPPTAKMLELALTLACNHPCYESRTQEQKGKTKTWLYVLLFFVLTLLQTLPLFSSLLYCFYKSGHMLKLGIQDQHRHNKTMLNQHFWASLHLCCPDPLGCTFLHVFVHLTLKFRPVRHIKIPDLPSEQCYVKVSLKQYQASKRELCIHGATVANLLSFSGHVLSIQLLLVQLDPW